MDSKHIFTEYSQQPLHVNYLFQSFSFIQSSTETVLVISIKLHVSPTQSLLVTYRAHILALTVFAVRSA